MSEAGGDVLDKQANMSYAFSEVIYNHNHIFRTHSHQMQDSFRLKELNDSHFAMKPLTKPSLT